MVELQGVATLLGLGLTAMVPLSLAASGETVNEKAGTFNISLEGIMLLSSFIAVIAAEATGTWLGGMMIGAIIGAAIGLVHGYASNSLKGDQLIIGVGINIFALGFVAFGLIAVYHTPGHHQLLSTIQAPRIPTPFGLLSPLLIVTPILAVVSYVLLNKTVFGLRVKAAGENPEAADVAGIKVDRIRIVASVYGGALAGLAGAFLSLDWLSFATKEISAGRGFIALAVVVFSGLNPLLALGGAFLFGFFDALRTWVVITPGVKEVVPFQFVNMLPYVVTLAVVAGAIGKRRFPKALGVPYRRE